MLLKVAVLSLSVGNVYGESGECPQEVPPNLYTMHLGGNQPTNKNTHTLYTHGSRRRKNIIYICDCTREE